MHQKDDIDRFDESFTTFLELGYYLFAHSEVTNQRWTEAFKGLEEARTEAEKARAEANTLKICLGWVIENFPDIDLNLLIEEPKNRANPSYADAEVATAVHVVEATPKVPKPMSAAFGPAQELEAAESVPTSLVGEPPKI
ncbi:hypothetical protein COCNU_scaffold002848G000010 [Cocos nucifera]|nr:hypothetical protein [Cocos nucifera]